MIKRVEYVKLRLWKKDYNYYNDNGGYKNIFIIAGQIMMGGYLCRIRGAAFEGFYLTPDDRAEGSGEFKPYSLYPV